MGLLQFNLLLVGFMPYLQLVICMDDITTSTLLCILTKKKENEILLLLNAYHLGSYIQSSFVNFIYVCDLQHITMRSVI